jgi:predicted GNAT family N-acyltransferase
LKVLITPADWGRRQQELLRIRFAVFVDEQGVPPELEHDEHDHHALHLIAMAADGTPVATARMLPDGHIGRMAVLPTWRGQGIGTAMLRDLIALAAERGIGHLFLNAQCEAESFYRRLGFQAEGGIFQDAGIDHRRMTLQLG